jgi:hypothetical protein
MISEHMVRLTQTIHISYVKVSTISKQTETSIHLTQTMIFEPIVCLKQAMHLSCANTNTVSKWTETRFHMTNVTL